MVYKKETKVQFSSNKVGYSFEPADGFEEYKYAMEMLYTDVRPYEIIETKGRKICLREMEGEQVATMDFTPGGFVGHTNNSQQRWELTSNPKGRLIWASLRKDGRFRLVGSQNIVFNPDTEPYRFHDFNF